MGVQINYPGLSVARETWDTTLLVNTVIPQCKQLLHHLIRLVI